MTEPIGKEEADDYFVSIDWRVGYYFRNDANDWQKIVPDAEPSDGEAEILKRQGLLDLSHQPGQAGPVKRPRSPAAPETRVRGRDPSHRGSGLSLRWGARGSVRGGMAGGLRRYRGTGNPQTLDTRFPPTRERRCRLHRGTGNPQTFGCEVPAYAEPSVVPA